MKRKLLLTGAMLLVALPALSACGYESGSTAVAALDSSSPLPARRNTVLVDGCVLDPWQAETLASPSAKKVIAEVIMLCLVPRADGTVGPADPSAKAALAALSGTLHADGYRVELGISFTDESGQRFDGVQTTTQLGDATWRAAVVGNIIPLAVAVDGLDLDLEKLEDSAHDGVLAFVQELSAAARPTKTLSTFVPPSVSLPSDIPGGNAFDLVEIAPSVDRIRVATLDYSTDGPAGPTIDPGWAVDAYREAVSLAPNANIDIAYPLYGTDFSAQGSRWTTYTEAIGLSQVYNAPIGRGPTGAPFVAYTDDDNEPHQTWFDDAQSTTQALAGWDSSVMPTNVGIVFWGLGSEDPALWDEMARRSP